MFKKILLPLDGSENAERALAWIKLYAERARSQIVALRVVTPPAGIGSPLEADVTEAREYLQGIERLLNFKGVPAKTELRDGIAPAEITWAAKTLGTDLIVMTTRGGSKVSRWLMGGVTEQVLRRSPVPVLVVRSQTPMPRQARVSRIVVPLDGSSLSDAVRPWVEPLARFHRARVTFLHVSPRELRDLAESYDKEYESLQQRTARFCHALRARGIKADFHVTHGDPATEILRASRDAGLIAMATHGYGGFKRWILGSVAEKVIHQASVPVFVHRTAVVPKAERTTSRARETVTVI